MRNIYALAICWLAIGPMSCGGGATAGPTPETVAAPGVGALPRPTSVGVSPTPTATPIASATELPNGAVRTDTGTFIGTVNGGVESFLGIPYAAAPVGTLRFMPPQAIGPAAGVTAATSFKPSCFAKPGPTVLGTKDPSPVGSSEDCLYLNVWAPSDLLPSKPVDVWIYGGAFVSGYADIYPGAQFANKGIVFVSFDYRMGIFGFFSHPGLDAMLPQHTSGNQGVLDQIAVLKWVQRNIASIGGDPTRVTIHGQSAGAGSIEALIASPLAKGLFKQAIAESPYLGMHPQYTTAQAESYYAANGYGGSLSLLQQETANALNLAQPGESNLNGTAGPYAAEQYAPTVDGYVLPSSEKSLYASGSFNRANLLVGTCDDEGLAFTQGTYAEYETAPTFDAYLNQIYGSDGAQAQALYPAPETGSAEDQLGQVFGDAIFNDDARAMARYESNAGNAVWRYVYTRPEPEQSSPETHACEIPFVFPGLMPSAPAEPSFALDTGAPAQEALVNGAWAQFIKTGNPNGPTLSNWPQYDDAEPYLEFAASGPVPRATPYRQDQLNLVDSYVDSLPAGDLPSVLRRH